MNTRLPCTVRVPIELPGASVPPLMVVLPIDAGAADGAAALTVSAELAIEPFTDSVPALTVVEPR